MNQDIEKWDNIAKKYSQKIENDLFREKFLYPLILNSLGNVKSKTILDAGCATGIFSRILAKKGTKVFAIDGSKEILKIAEEDEKKNPLGIKYKLTDLNKKLDYKDNFFDCIVAIHILMDIQNLQNALSEFARILKPKGKLVFSISHPCFTHPTLKWKKGILGRIDFKWGYAKLFDYFPSRKVNKPLVGKDCPISHYHRLIEDYINGLIKAGFSIAKIEEPKMSSGLAQKTDFFLAHRIAMVLIINANKLR